VEIGGHRVRSACNYVLKMIWQTGKGYFAFNRFEH
jgi:hypothetical protein